MAPRYANDEDRITRNVLVDANSCWLWLGAKTDRGYGTLRRNGKNHRAHRFSYALYVGPIPEGMEIDHLCRVRHCVNPDHLEAVDHRTNMLRSENFTGQNARKDACPSGHPYDEANTYVVPSTGRRMCRQCLYDRNARYEAEGRTKALRDARRERTNARRREQYARKRASAA